MHNPEWTTQVEVRIKKEKCGVYSVVVPSLPGCVSQGKTITDAMQNITEALGLVIESYLDLKKPVPWLETQEIARFVNVPIDTRQSSWTTGLV